MNFLRILLFIASTLLSTCIERPCSAQGEWPQFRGQAGQGGASSDRVPLDWGEAKNVAWKTPIAGKGWSSPVVFGDQIWLTTAIEESATEEEAAQRKVDPDVEHLPISILKSIKLLAICIDRHTGKLLHEIELFQVDWPEPIHSLNSYASPTPILEPGRAYIHFGTWGTACLDTQTAEVVWRAKYPLQHMVGPGSSPVLHGDQLILTCDGADQQFMVALDKTTGQEVWRTPRPPISAEETDYHKSFCTPLIIEGSPGPQVIAPGAQWLVSYDPATGTENWRVEHGEGFSLVAVPVFDGNRVYVCTGFSSPTTLLAVRVDGQGDVTETHVDWRSTSQVSVIPSPLLSEGMLFMVSNGGVATCLDAATGKKHWQKRIGGNFCSSPVCVDNRIYLSSQEGSTTVLAASDSFEKLASNQLDSRIMASPAVLAEGLLLRTEEALYLLSTEK